MLGKRKGSLLAVLQKKCNDNALRDDLQASIAHRINWVSWEKFEPEPNPEMGGWVCDWNKSMALADRIIRETEGKDSEAKQRIIQCILTDYFDKYVDIGCVSLLYTDLESEKLRKDIVRLLELAEEFKEEMCLSWEA